MKTTPSKFRPMFLVTKEETNKVIIVAGTTQVSPIEFESEEQAETYLQEQPYEMFLNLFSICKYYENQDKKQTKENVEKDA